MRCYLESQPESKRNCGKILYSASLACLTKFQESCADTIWLSVGYCNWRTHASITNCDQRNE